VEPLVPPAAGRGAWQERSSTARGKAQKRVGRALGDNSRLMARPYESCQSGRESHRRAQPGTNRPQAPRQLASGADAGRALQAQLTASPPQSSAREPSPPAAGALAKAFATGQRDGVNTFHRLEAGAGSQASRHIEARERYLPPAPNQPMGQTAGQRHGSHNSDRTDSTGSLQCQGRQTCCRDGAMQLGSTSAIETRPLRSGIDLPHSLRL